MKSRSMLLGAAILACLAFALPTQAPKQDSRQEDQSKKIDALTRALEVEKKRTTELETRLDRVDAWFVSLRAACEGFDAAANEARKNGFESAGANPLAKTNVLDGMKKFASEMTRSAPAPK